MLNQLTVKQARQGLDKKEFSAVELTKDCLHHISDKNDKINAFITVCGNRAMRQAEQADKMINSGDCRTLTGIPYGVKDTICIKGVRSTGAAKILDSYRAPYQATVIKKIDRQNAVMIGKQNCDAFGHGASNENSMYGLVRNPHDQARVPGGSSGGSAAALADNQCLFSVAEDTGGSIRQPASFCGVAGLRPSYGRNSRYGVMPMASSLDTIGPMAKTVADIALIMTVIAGFDDKDATTLPKKVPQYVSELRKTVGDLKIGIPKEYFELDGLDYEVEQVMSECIEKVKSLGIKLMPLSLPHTKYAIAAYYIIVPSEDSSNLGRLDGIRYGQRFKASDLYHTYAKSRALGFPSEVKRRIMMGTYALSAGYYDAYYRKAQRVRTLIRKDFDEVFRKVDLLLTPTSPFPAFKVGEKVDNILSMYAADVFVAPAALAGLPALSVPIGVTNENLPVGAQIIGRTFEEEKVLWFGDKIEK